MGTAGLETVLIGHPVDGVGDSLRFVRVRSFGDGADLVSFLADLFLFSGLVESDSVLGLVATPFPYKFTMKMGSLKAIAG